MAEGIRTSEGLSEPQQDQRVGHQVHRGLLEHPLPGLVVEVVAVLAEAGLFLYDPSGADGELGGVCLTPEAALDGVVVSWRQHDRMSLDQLHGAAADALVQQVMNRALAEVLVVRGFAVEPLGGACVVREGEPAE